MFRSESDMTQADRDLAASAQPAIRADAALAGVEFDRGNWSYQQLECQALPGHLFLLYKGDNGTGDVSLLSAAIPRTGHGHATARRPRSATARDRRSTGSEARGLASAALSQRRTAFTDAATESGYVRVKSRKRATGMALGGAATARR